MSNYHGTLVDDTLQFLQQIDVNVMHVGSEHKLIFLKLLIGIADHPSAWMSNEIKSANVSNTLLGGPLGVFNDSRNITSD